MVTFVITWCLTQGAGLRGVAIIVRVRAATEPRVSILRTQSDSGLQSLTALFSCVRSLLPRPWSVVSALGADNSDVSVIKTSNGNDDSQTDISVREETAEINRDVKRRGIYRLNANVSRSCDGLMRSYSHSRVFLAVTARRAFVVYHFLPPP